MKASGGSDSGVARQGALAHGTAVVFKISGEHAALAADTGTVDPRSGTRRVDRCKIDVLSDPVALVGVGGAVVLGDERWALEILSEAARSHRPVDKASAHALVDQFKSEMETQMRRYPVHWGDAVDIQGVVIIPTEHAKGFSITVFQGAQRIRKGDLSLDMGNFEFVRTAGAEHHAALEMGVQMMHEVEESTTERGRDAANRLDAKRTPREYAERAVEYAKQWYPEHVFGSIDVATLDTGVAHLYRSTACSRPKFGVE